MINKRHRRNINVISSVLHRGITNYVNHGHRRGALFTIAAGVKQGYDEGHRDADAAHLEDNLSSINPQINPQKGKR